MIDLSHLTEEEQEKIVSVLKRDAELKKADEQRIKRLQRSVPDKVKLKCMTGEWFYQTKSLRHKDRIHGSNIIRAAMRQEKAMTILELNQMLTETPSFVNSAIQDIFVPAELSGLIEEPSGTRKRSSDCISPVVLKEEIMQIMKSPEKMIQKHFDSVFEESEVSEGTGDQLAKWEAEHMVSFDEGLLPPSISHVGSLVKVSAEDEGSKEAVISETAPLPKLRTPSLDSMLDIRDELFSKWSDAMVEQNSISVVPKGILKHSSSCGFADFPILFSEIESGPCSEFLNTQEPERNDRPAQRSESLHSLDRKQVRFSAVVSMNELDDQTPTLSDGESGGQDLLETQGETHSEGKDGVHELSIGSYMGESAKYLTDGKTAPKFQKESGDGHSDMTVPESIPGKVTSPPVYEPQNGGLGVKWEEEDGGEAESDGEGKEKRDEDIGPSKRAGGQHEHDAVTPTQCFEDQEGKLVHAKAQVHGLFSGPAEQSHMVAEEQRRPISEVQDEFDRNDKHSQQPGNQKAEKEFVILGDSALVDRQTAIIDSGRTNSAEEKSQLPQMGPSELRVKGPEGSDTKALTAYGNVSHIEQMTDSSTGMKHPDCFSLCSGTGQKETCITASENMLSPASEDKFRSQEDAQNKNILLSRSMMGQARLTMKQNDIYEKAFPQRLANLKSFWENGNSGSRIPIRKSSKNFNTNATVEESVDKKDAEGGKCSDSGIDLCNIGRELSLSTVETVPIPEMKKSSYKYYMQPFRARKESAPHPVEADINRSSTDSANSSKIPEYSSPSGFQSEEYSSRGQDSLNFEESFSYLVGRNMSENQNEEEISIAKQYIIGDKAPIAVKTDMQISPPGQKSSPKHNSEAFNRQAGRQRRDKITQKSFWEKEKSGPSIKVSKQKGFLGTKVNQIPEAIPSHAEEEMTTSESDIKTVGIELDDDGDTRSFLPTMKENTENDSENKSANNAQYKPVDDFTHIVPSVKTVSTEDIRQCVENTKSMSRETSNVVLQRNQLLVDEPCPDYPPQIPPRRPITPKTEMCPSKTHSADACPPIRELIEKDQERISRIRWKKTHPSERLLWEPGAKKKVAFSMGRPPHSQRSRLPQLWKGIENSTVGQSVVPEAVASREDKESKPEPPRRTSIGSLPETTHFAYSNDHNEGNVASSENDRRHPSSGRASEGLLARLSTEAQLPHPLPRSLIPKANLHNLRLPGNANRNEWSGPATERREEGSLSRPLTQPEAGLDILLEPVQTSIQEPPREITDLVRDRRGSYDHGADGTLDFDSSGSNTPDACSNSWASSDCIDESQSPVVTSKQISARPIAVSKSLEDMTSEEIISPVASTPSSSFSEREQMKKRCASLPAFLQGERDGRDSDSGSESNFHFGGRHSSASTNFSTSSGMASMSSASSSLMSIYSQEFENLEVKGSIQFSLSYVEKVRELHVLVIRCRDLTIADAKKNRSDPYVKSYLLPDKGKLGKKKTSVKKKTVNPIYNEILRYKIDLDTLKSQVLNLSVWHRNSFGRNNFLGEVDFQLSEWDIRNTHMNDFTLKSKVPLSLLPSDQRGEIRLALRFLQQCSIGKRTPKNGLVQIFVKECTNLPLLKGTAIDPFVKCFVLPDSNRKSRQKSRVLRRTSNPVFNHTMVYDGFRAEDLQDACVELTVWDHDRLNNHFVGGIRLNLGTGRSYGSAVHWMDSNAAEALLWERMINAQNEWVEEVLPLRMLVMAHSMSK